MLAYFCLSGELQVRDPCDRSGGGRRKGVFFQKQVKDTPRHSQHQAKTPNPGTSKPVKENPPSLHFGLELEVTEGLLGREAVKRWPLTFVSDDLSDPLQAVPLGGTMEWKKQQVYAGYSKA
ncbi:hypothetical protein P7K49_029695 [Saguinus oedipus]|uniref:Uncharacterized protein n=1 Tax=Saguinus oedipus TaxID=9490 RepID=A0ABQ9U804_SAGOE|nr:hypothetical protein P7K49_029695 [Saguinus oedipus]